MNTVSCITRSGCRAGFTELAPGAAHTAAAQGAGVEPVQTPLALAPPVLQVTRRLAPIWSTVSNLYLDKLSFTHRELHDTVLWRHYKSLDFFWETCIYSSCKQFLLFIKLFWWFFWQMLGIRILLADLTLFLLICKVKQQPHNTKTSGSGCI